MIYLCDFEDSFTYNIYTELCFQKLPIQIIKKKSFINFLEEKILSKEKCLIILGPGPGHPNEYEKVIQVLKKAILEEYLYFYGICLGHQLLCEVLGLSVVRSLHPIHGERVELALSEHTSQIFNIARELKVQRYNSLSVIMNRKEISRLNELGIHHFSHEKELMGLKGKNFLTYQFHPESVGTTFRSQFFRDLSRLES